MVYGQLGRMPLIVNIKSRILNYWFKIVTCTENKLSVHLYNLMLAISKNNIVENKWLQYVEQSLNNLVLSNIWSNQGKGIHKIWFKGYIKQLLHDQYLQNWFASLNDSSKCLHYKTFKASFSFEPYLNALTHKMAGIYTKFRCRNHKLPIEKGCYANIPREQRLCTFCGTNTKQIGDEYHYVMVCSHFADIRKSFVKKYYFAYPTYQKFAKLFNSTGSELEKLCSFLANIMDSMD